MKKMWFVLLVSVLFSAFAPMGAQVEPPIPPDRDKSKQVNCVWNWVEHKWKCPKGTPSEYEKDCKANEFLTWAYIPGDTRPIYSCQVSTHAIFCIDGLEFGMSVGPNWDRVLSEEILEKMEYPILFMPVGDNPNITVGECPLQTEMVQSEPTGK